MSRGGLLYRAGIAVCAVGFLVSGGLFVRQWLEYRAGENAYEALTEAAVTPVPQPQAEAPEEPAGEAAPIQVDFDALSAVNPDVTGWIYLPDSVISYPVVQGEDNSYYLKHLFDGTPNSSGCLFLDSRCEGLTGRNSVIYGHYMKNGTLFGSLKEYRDQAYYDAHPVFYLITPEEVLTVQVFSAYIAGSEDSAWQLNFDSLEDYGAWLEELEERSCIKSAAEPESTDRVITLSTCSYEFQNARFVCHGLVREE